MEKNDLLEELNAIKLSIDKLNNDFKINLEQISLAENNILNDTKLSFWEPKLIELRNDKKFIQRTLEQLREQVVLREKFLFNKSNIISDNLGNMSSPPLISTDAAEGEVFNIFGIVSEEDFDVNPDYHPIHKDDGSMNVIGKKSSSNSKSSSGKSSPTVPKFAMPIMDIFTESLNIMEELIVMQKSEVPPPEDSKPSRSRSTSIADTLLDTFHYAEKLVLVQGPINEGSDSDSTLEETRKVSSSNTIARLKTSNGFVVVNPTGASAHDFSVFGVDYEDS